MLPRDRVSSPPAAPRLSREEITRRVAAIGDVTSGLANRSLAEKATLYWQLVAGAVETWADEPYRPAVSFELRPRGARG